MERQSVIGNLDINKILNDISVKRIFELTNYEKVYESLRLVAQKYSHDLKIQQNLKNILFIYYLKMSSKKFVRRNFFERVLISMNSFLDEEVMLYLLSQDLDMDYVGDDMYNTPVTLINELALNINSPRVMNSFLQKINLLNKKYFGISGYRSYTDLCRMNIIAGNLDRALEVFNEDDYKLFLKGIDDASILEEFKQGKVCLYIPNFLGEQSDILLQIIKTLKNRYISSENQRNFLNRILYNKKIKLFNVANLPLIEEILEQEEYQKFVEYLSSRVTENEMTLFSLRIKDDTLYYESLENTFQTNDKVLSLTDSTNVDN